FNTSTGPWDNTTTLLSAGDFSYLLCKLDRAVTTACATPGNVGTATGVAAGPKYVIGGTTDGALAGSPHTLVVEPYYADNVADTPEDTSSQLWLIQLDTHGALVAGGKFGLPWSPAVTHEIGGTSPLRTFYAAVPGFSTAAGEVRLVKL